MARKQELMYVISGDTSGIRRALSQTNRGLGKLGKQTSLHARLMSGGLSRVGVAATGAAAGVGVVVAAGTRFVQASRESAKVGAQTRAVLESTGATAGVTAKHVETLATSLSRKTAVDDEAIQSAENLLLTFANIRNEAGAGNRIFDRTTAAVLDMSAAFKQDAKASAIQLGKALNDPVKGLSALSRVGVSFTAQQREQVKALVESGDVLSAQKIILREVETQTKGSAASQADALDHLQVTIGNVEEALGDGLRPTVNAVARELDEFVSGKTPGLERLVATINTIFARKDLDLGEKLKLSGSTAREALAPLVAGARKALDRADLGKKLAVAVERGAPMMADAAARAAPRAAVAFVRAFTEAGPWGKLLTTAFLISKLGGFRAAGGWAAGALATAFRSRMANQTAITSAVQAAGRDAGQKGATSIASRLKTRLPGAVKALSWAAPALAIGSALTLALQQSGVISGVARWLANAITGTSKEEIAGQMRRTSDRSLRGARRLRGEVSGRIPYVKPDGSTGYIDAGPPRRVQIGRAVGGRVPGTRIAADTVPAMLSPQEFVVTGHGERVLESMTFPGVLDWLQGKQRPHFNTGGRVQRFAKGGKPMRGLITGAYGTGYEAGVEGRRSSGILSQVLEALSDRVGAIGGASGSSRGGGVPAVVARMASFGRRVASKGFPYVYGGGHNSSFAGPYDCSGFVSAILHAGGLLASPMTTDGLKTFGRSGSGEHVTIGVRGSTGRNAHTMIKIGDQYFEAGGGGGAGVRGGWSGSFPIKRHPVGLRGGGRVGVWERYMDPKSPYFVGWGLRTGGRVAPIIRALRSTNRIALPGLLRKLNAALRSPGTTFNEVVAARSAVTAAMRRISRGGIAKSELSSYRGLKGALSLAEGEAGRRIGVGVSRVNALVEQLGSDAETLALTLRAEGVTDTDATQRTLLADRTALGDLLKGRERLKTTLARAKRTKNKGLVRKVEAEIATIDRAILSKRGDITEAERTLTESAGQQEKDRLIEVIEAQTAATQEHTAALNAAKDEIKRQNEIAARVQTSDYQQLKKAIASIVAGELGGRIGLGFQSPSFAGGFARY